MYLHVFDATKKAMYMDKPGHFPVTYASGNKYLMVVVKLDGNYIDAEPMPARTAKELICTYQTIYQWWKVTGVICPYWHILDNKAPEEFKQAIYENGCRVELPPAMQLNEACKCSRAISFLSLLACLTIF